MQQYYICFFFCFFRKKNYFFSVNAALESKITTKNENFSKKKSIVLEEIIYE